MSNISAVIFDMDGLLIDSEPIWREAEIEVFNRVNVPLTEAMCHETTGMRMSAATQYWFSRFPWSGKSVEDVEDEVIKKVSELIKSDLIIKPGAKDIVLNLFNRDLPLAICSSSPIKIIESVVDQLELRDKFRFLYSAEAEKHGKPHPAPYLTCSQRLEVEPESCLVFEDSLTGAISAKAALMKVVAIPEEHNRHSTKFDFCDYRFDSLDGVDLNSILSCNW